MGWRVSPDYTPFHGGLDRLISWKKGHFISPSALEDVKAKGPDRHRLRSRKAGSRDQGRGLSIHSLRHDRGPGGARGDRRGS
ncbi:hypothetical protein D9M69_688040 [compost metagenome]